MEEFGDLLVNSIQPLASPADSGKTPAPKKRGKRLQPAPALPPPPAFDNAPLGDARGALTIREIYPLTALLNVLAPTLKHYATAQGVKLYRDQMLAAHGNPTDPVEVMMLDQLLLAQVRIGLLQSQAAKIDAPEAVHVLQSDANSTMAEFRKTALALREYRSPKAPTQVTVFKQQNVAAGNQQVALVEAAQNATGRDKRASNSKLASKPELIEHVAAALPFAAANSRQTELAETQGTHAGRS